MERLGAHLAERWKQAEKVPVLWASEPDFST